MNCDLAERLLGDHGWMFDPNRGGYVNVGLVEWKAARKDGKLDLSRAFTASKSPKPRGSR